MRKIYIDTLKHFWDNPGDQLKKASHAMGLSYVRSSSLNKRLKTLVERGFMEQRPGKGGAYYITPKGIEAISQ